MKGKKRFNGIFFSKERFVRYWNYLSICLRHLTLKKLFNLFRIEYRLNRNKTDLAGLSPYILFVEVSNACNLRCPVCVMGRRNLIPRKNLISYDRYISLVSPIKDRLLMTFLYNWAEPFLNPEVYNIIKWNSRSNIGTIISSNLSLPIDAEEIVKSGLDYLVISGDGITQEVYEKYRVGGRLDLVLKNLSDIVAAKRKLRSKRPYIEWQCLVSKYNEFQMGEIESRIRAIGANEVRFASMNFLSLPQDVAAKEEKEWLPENPAFHEFSSANILNAAKAGRRKACYWLWRTAVVNTDGSMVPCCLFDVPGWGDAFGEGVLNVWNNKYFNTARGMVDCSQREGKGIICSTCTAPFISRKSRK